MPYTTAYVGALSMGFTTADLATMPLNRLMWFTHCRNGMHAGASKPAVIEGTADMMKNFVG